MIRATFMLALLSGVAIEAPQAIAAPVDGLAPMAFLADHCWKGSFADGIKTDEHCFRWLYDGKALRDTHTVRAPGKADYVGETTYYWNSMTHEIEFLYVENQGGVSRGTMRSGDGTLTFPPTQYIEDGNALTYRVQWTRQGDDAYEVWSEMQASAGWATMFRMTLKREP